jgi:hypothetical protein
VLHSRIHHQRRMTSRNRNYRVLRFRLEGSQQAFQLDRVQRDKRRLHDAIIQYPNSRVRPPQVVWGLSRSSRFLLTTESMEGHRGIYLWTVLCALGVLCGQKSSMPDQWGWWSRSKSEQSAFEHSSVRLALAEHFLLTYSAKSVSGLTRSNS